MDRPHFRPRFVLLAEQPLEVVRETIRARLEASPHVEGRVRNKQVLAWIAASERKVWSPSIDLNLRPHPRGTLVVGLVAPHPKLMTGYVFASIALGFLFAIACSWSFVQVSMGDTPWCLVGIGLGVVAGAVLLGTRALGILWARPQIAPLAALVDGFGEPRDDELQLLQEALDTLHLSPN